MKAVYKRRKVGKRFYAGKVVEDVLDVGVWEKCEWWKEINLIMQLFPKLVTKLLQSNGSHLHHLLCESKRHRD